MWKSLKRFASRLQGRARPLADEDPESLRFFVGQVKDYAIYKLDAQGRVATWSLGAERLKGYTRSEILGQHFSRFYTPEDIAAGKPEMELRLARTYGSHQEEGWRVRKDGGRFLANVVLTALRDAEGQVNGYVKVTRDVTMQKDAEDRLISFARELEDAVALQTRALRENEARLAGFARNAPAAIAFKDLQGRYLLVNPRMEAILGRPREEIVGRTSLEVLPEPLGAEVQAQDLTVLTSRQPMEKEEHWTHPDGTLHAYLTQRFPLVDPEGQVWGVGRISTDITERKAAEQVRLQSQKLESLGVLAGGIAHDFNNLLGAILGNLGLAQREISPTSHARVRLDTIESLVVKATSLTRQMLAYSGRGTTEIVPLDLNKLVEEMTHLLTISISKKVEVRISAASGIPTIMADASQLQQVVMNLVINASDAIGDRPGTIVVRTGVMSADETYLAATFQGQHLEPGTFVSLEVADDGSGMSAETMKRIFEPFFTTKFTGRGLGLSAIQGIIKSHRGGIRVYSEVGRGTTFKLLFPAASVPAGVKAPEAALGDFHGNGTVLVVDDEESIRSMASGILSQMGFDALLAADGMEALMLFETHKADIRLVILDLTMPHMDGVETLTALRDRGHQTPVVLSSGFNESEAIPRIKDQSLAGFLQKPYRVSSFIQVVKAALKP